MITPQSALSAASGILVIAGYLPYIAAIVRRKAKPSKATWIIWASLDIILIYSMRAKGALNVQIVAATIGAWTVTILALKYGESGWTKKDKICFAGAIVSLVLWYALNDPVFAIISSLAVLLIGSVPTFAATWHKPHLENRTTWVLFWLSSLCAVIAIPVWTLEDAAQPMMFFAIASVMLYLVCLRPRTHYWHLNQQAAERMQLGIKRIEARLNDEKRQKVKGGDSVVFLDEYDHTPLLRIVVSSVVRCSTFDELLERYDSYQYFGKQRDRLLARLRKPTGRYAWDKEKHYGVCGVLWDDLKVLTKN